MRAVASLNILFIGNSFTARNNLPGLVAQLAAASGRQLEHRLISVGGASLRTHWNKGEASQTMRRERYDYVVLQEQSTLPIKNAQRMHENVRLFDAAIKDTGAKTALYMTWARAHAPETQQAITDGYTTIAAELGATLLPVGVAWQRFMATHDRPVLHDRDKSHPSLAGSYLAACVMFGVLFECSPVGNAAKIEGLSEAETKILQASAVISSRPSNRVGPIQGRSSDRR